MYGEMFRQGRHNLGRGVGCLHRLLYDICVQAALLTQLPMQLSLKVRLKYMSNMCNKIRQSMGSLGWGLFCQGADQFIFGRWNHEPSCLLFSLVYFVK